MKNKILLNLLKNPKISFTDIAKFLEDFKRSDSGKYFDFRKSSIIPTINLEFILNEFQNNDLCRKELHIICDNCRDSFTIVAKKTNNVGIKVKCENCRKEFTLKEHQFFEVFFKIKEID